LPRVIEERTLEPGGSTQLGVPFNAVTQRPRLEVKIDVPSHVKNLVECDDVLLGRAQDPEKSRRVFRIRNKSSWPAFLTFLEHYDED